MLEESNAVVLSLNSTDEARHQMAHTTYLVSSDNAAGTKESGAELISSVNLGAMPVAL